MLAPVALLLRWAVLIFWWLAGRYSRWAISSTVMKLLKGCNLRCIGRGPRRLLVVWVAHNFGVSAEAMKRASDWIAKGHALEVDGIRAVVWVAGDWSFLAVGEPVF